MKKVFVILFALTMLGCSSEEAHVIDLKQVNWKERTVEVSQQDSLSVGQSYLPLYSHIYHIQEDRTFDLTVTVSIRNVSSTDTLFLNKADFFDTHGELVHAYIKETVYVEPLETLEIVLGEKDERGGSGANFIFDWAINNPKHKPLFEAVMISTYGQQGISFTTRGEHLD